MNDLRQLPLFMDEDEALLEEGLDTLLRLQHPFLQRLQHHNLDKDTLARYGTALMIEVAEFVNETPWKLWKEYPEELTPLQKSKLVEEYADILAFMGTWLNFLELMGIDPDDVAAGYIRKVEKNHARFNGTSGEAGYTGVASR